MKNIKSIPFYLFLIALCSIFVVSCSEDNPVTQTPEESYQYDSARFSWNVDTLFGQGFYAGLWAKDTNDIFITNVFTNQLVHIQNGVKTFTQYPLLGAVLGDEMNNGYLVAAILINNIYQPFIQKYEGNNFIDIPVPQNLDENFFFNAVKIKNPNEMWFGMTGGNILKYDGSKFTPYDLENPDLVITKFFYDELGIINCLSYDPHYKIDRIESLQYKLIGNTWIKVYSDFYISRTIKYDVLGDKVSGSGYNEIYELVDSILVPKINVPIRQSYLITAGNSFDNVMLTCAERLPNSDIASIINWNGEKWSIELSNYPMYDSYLQMINQNIFYAISFNAASNETNVIRGIKNN